MKINNILIMEVKKWRYLLIYLSKIYYECFGKDSVRTKKD